MTKRHLGFSTLLLMAISGYVQGQEQNSISVAEERPEYWRYKGKTVLLLGGSDEDNLFQMPEVEKQLDLLKGVGGNYVRCTMSSRDPGNVWPFYFNDSTQLYDLTRWNPEYWNRFENFLEACAKRDIIVQVEVWATFDFYRGNWDVNPFNPKNNRNYTQERARLPLQVATHPTRCDNPFFWSIPMHDNNMPVLYFQQRFVEKLIEHTFNYDNVLYCIDNETSVTAAWGSFWSSYLRSRAREEGKTIHVTEMWDPWDLDHISHRESFDHPELYSFVDISQNNHKRGQEHWDNGLAQIKRLEKNGLLRPVNNIKTYGSDGGRHGGVTKDAIQKFIQSVLFGSAAVRFHRPPSGIGLTSPAQNVLQSTRELTDAITFFEAKPHNDLLMDREENEAYCRALPGEEYLIYFPNGGEISLDFSEEEAKFSVYWLSITDARWHKGKSVKGGQMVTVRTPDNGQWAVVVKKEL